LCAAREKTQLSFPAPPLPRNVKLPLFIHPTVEPIPAADKRLKLTKEREEAKSTLTEFGETVRRAERKNRAHQNRPRSSFFPTSLIRALLDSLPSIDSLEKLKLVLHSWIFAAGYRARLYAVVHSLRTTINSERETERLERNAKQRAMRQKKKKTYLSESEDEMEDDGEDESDDQLSTDEEEDVHPHSSPIPPSPKRQQRVLEEVTNAGNSARPTAKKAARKSLQCVAEVSQSYSAPCRTSRRRAVQN
jgi:hypothetical protein